MVGLLANTMVGTVLGLYSKYSKAMEINDANIDE